MPAFALVHEKLHSGRPLVVYAGSPSFFLEIGKHPLIRGAAKAVKSIDAFDRLDHSGPAPNALIVDHRHNNRFSLAFLSGFIHGKPPCQNDSYNYWRS
jgi:hypothetical protein